MHADQSAQSSAANAAAGSLQTVGTRVDAWALAAAIIGICATGPIISASSAPVFAMAAWRCMLGACFIALLLRVRGWLSLRSISRRDWLMMGLSGALLALHFATWIPSLRYTTVASSTALVATQPVWAALIARMRGRSVPPRMVIGIGVAITGAVVLAGSDLAFTSPQALIGDALALAGAITAAAYVTVGEKVRASVPTLPYSMVAYMTAAVMLFAVCAASGTPLFDYSGAAWQSILALTLAGQIIGHTLINRSLRTMSATVASTAILFEMPGSTLLAAVFLQQHPPMQVWPALALVLAGLIVVVRAQPTARS